MQQSLILVQNVSIKDKKRSLLYIANFEIHRGIIYGITGQPGSGKTLFLELLAGKRRSSEGTFHYEGEPVDSRQLHRKYGHEIYYLPQSDRLQGRQTVEKYLLKHIRLASWSNDTPADRIKSISKRMSLGDKLSLPLDKLSPGQRRWVQLAVCLAADARLLLLDEIELHLGYDQLELVKRLLLRKSMHEGTTVILTTASPQNMRRLSGVLVTLDRGRIAMIRSLREGGRGRRTTSGNEHSGDSRSRYGNRKSGRT
jgi:ABC-type multidrug transport system ATPase subunit